MKVKPADLEIGMRVPVADPYGVKWIKVLSVHRQYDQSTRWRIDLEDRLRATGMRSIYVHTDQEIEVRT